jgi:1,6-anhydro-N-acetylmuramate kinase
MAVLRQRGAVDEDAIKRLLAHEFFARPPRKSLDRNALRGFVAATVGDNGASTLTAAVVPHLPRAGDLDRRRRRSAQPDVDAHARRAA